MRSCISIRSLWSGADDPIKHRSEQVYSRCSPLISRDSSLGQNRAIVRNASGTDSHLTRFNRRRYFPTLSWRFRSDRFRLPANRREWIRAGDRMTVPVFFRGTENNVQLNIRRLVCSRRVLMRVPISSPYVLIQTSFNNRDEFTASAQREQTSEQLRRSRTGRYSSILSRSWKGAMEFSIRHSTYTSV